MKGYKRWRAGAWRFTVDAGTDPITGKRRQATRSFRAPNTRAGARQADVELARFVTELDAGRTAAAAGLTVTDLIERYVQDHAAEWGQSGVEATRARAGNHITPHVGDIPVGKLRPADVKHLHSQLRAGGQAEASVARVHAILQAALQWAVDLELVDRNVAARRKPRVPKAARTDPGDDVMVALLKAADGDMLCYLRLAAVTGARRGHMVALRWRDIDLDGGSVTFTRALARVRGGTVEKSGKAGVDYRVTVDERTVEIVRAHRARAAERALAAGVKVTPSGFVFTLPATPDGSRPWHPDGVNQRFNRIRAKVAGAEAVTPHQFRHWMATAMFEDDYDPITVAGRGGWASPALPLSTYGHRRPARDEAAAVSLAARLDKSS